MKLSGPTLCNSPFWTTHLYQCNNVIIENCRITAPREPVRAPSSDAIDLDVCSNVIVRDCYLNCDDDGVCIKGGKGVYANRSVENGIVENILVERCTFGPNLHGTLTLGSECIHARNIEIRDCHVNTGTAILRLKMRPDTYQIYENVTVKNITGSSGTVIDMKPWKQFFTLEGSNEKPYGIVRNILIENVDVKVKSLGTIAGNADDTVSNFVMRNIKVEASNPGFECIYPDVRLENVVMNGKPVENPVNNPPRLYMLSKKVKEFIHRHLPQSPRIIVGLSGGADSMALLLALKEAGCHILAAHCNFHLRGAESNRDQEHCKSICRMLGVKLVTIDFDVTARRAETGESVEMACRSLRYNWWNGLIDSGIGEYIAVGHHCEDNVETLFLNLLRGSGIAGLKGMLPVNERIVRPLLECTRAEIEDYVSGRGYIWVTDSTNSENEYKRNRLRNVIIPMLELEFPGAISSIVRSLGVLRENFSLYKALTGSRFSLYDSDGIIDIERLIRCEPQPRAILHESLTSFGFTHSQIDDLYDCVTNVASDTTSGQMFITPKGRYIYERGKLSRHSETIDEEREINLSEHPFSMLRISISDFWDELRNGMSNKNVIYFDSSVLEGNPKWSMRSWRQGDRLAPFGMKGSRLVSDLYTDAKYNSRQKHSVPLLFRDGVLMWVIGLRASRHFKVNDATTSVIKITFE